MPCKIPVRVYRSYEYNNETRKRPLVHSPRDGFEDAPVYRPCGQCIDCRIDRAREWSIRIMHESTLHDKNSFITLTYSDDNLEYFNETSIAPTISKRTFQLFLKRLRKYFDKCGIKIRYFGVGEYGEKTSRPHYHLCLFGADFGHDRRSHDGDYFISDTLSDTWSLGNCLIGKLEYDSASYVAGYVTEKLTGKMAVEYEVRGVLPPFALMSRAPGLAWDWIDQWCDDVYPRDTVYINGSNVRPPRYYDEYLRKHDPQLYQSVMLERFKNQSYCENPYAAVVKKQSERSMYLKKL